MIIDTGTSVTALEGNEIPPLTAGRPKRSSRLPARFRDTLPTPLVPVPPVYPIPDPQSIGSQIKRVTLIVRDRLVTMANIFGIWRDYSRRPSYDLDTVVYPDELSNLHTNISHDDINSSPSLCSAPSPPWPFANMTIWRLMTWMNSGSAAKSEKEINRLAETIRDAGGFPAADLEGFNAHRENQRFDAAQRFPPFSDGF
jgi:hypothetical protein